MEVKLKQQWLQMGVELEGAWSRANRSVVSAEVRGAKAVKDPSVHIGIGDPGEIITRPHSDLEELIADVDVLWPDHVHESCGMHIHTSLVPLSMGIIASRDFYTYFKDQWDKWGKKEKLPSSHEFWRRLQGQNKHARDEFVPEQQLRGTGNGAKGSSARYTMLNFYAWEIHRTVECRLLPMFGDKNQGIRAIRHLAWVYDSYLAQYGFSNIVMEAASQIRGDTVVETYEYKTPEITPSFFVAEGYFPHLPTGEDIFYSIADSEHLMLPYKLDSGKQTP